MAVLILNILQTMPVAENARREQKLAANARGSVAVNARVDPLKAVKKPMNNRVCHVWKLNILDCLK